MKNLLMDLAHQHAIHQRHTAKVVPVTILSSAGVLVVGQMGILIRSVRTDRLWVIPIIKPNTYWVLTTSSILNTSHVLSHSTCMAILWVGHYHYPHFTVEEAETQSFINLLTVTQVERSETRIWKRACWLWSPQPWPLSDQALPHFTLESMLLWKPTFSCRPAASPNRKQPEDHSNHPASCKHFLSHPLLVSP